MNHHIILNLSSWPIRRKLLLLLWIVFLPVAAIIVAQGLHSRSHAIAEAENHASLLVHSLAAQQDQVSAGIKQMLGTLAVLPEVQRLDAAACNELFRELNNRHPDYSTIAAATPDGNMFAASAPFQPGTVDLSDRKHIKDAIRTLEFSVGEYIVGRVSKVQSMNYTYPVLDAGRKLIAIVIAGFKLDEYARFMKRANLPEGSVLVIADHAGVRLYRLPENDAAAAGKPIPRVVLQLITGEADQGIFHWTAQDGVHRIYAYRQLRLREDSTPYLYMIVGIPKDAVLAKANMEMLRNLLLLGVIVLTAMSLAWLFGELVLAKPMRSLVLAAQILGSGDMGARTNLSHTKDEVGQLAKSFDDMAGLLEAKSIEQREAERKLLHERRFSDCVIDSLPGVFYLFDAGGKLLRRNDNVGKVTGYSAEELSRMSPLDFFAEPDREKIARAIQEVFVDGRHSLEADVKSKTGEKIPHLLTGARLSSDNENYLVGVGIDLSDRKRAEDALRDSEEKFRSLFNESLAGIFLTAPDGRIFAANPAACGMLGRSEAEICEGGRDLVVDFTDPMLIPALEERMRTGRFNGELNYKRADGTSFPVEVSSGFFKTKEGEVRTSIVFCDISERKLAEQRLSRQYELQRALMSAIPAYVYIKDPDLVYMIGNKRFSELSGVPEDEIPGKTDYDFFPEAAAESFRGNDAEILASGKARLNYEMKGQDAKGDTIWFSTSKAPFYGSSGDIAGLVGVCLDITDQKRAEEERHRLEQQLQQVEKAESLGRMAGAIAHHFNNLLGVVMGNLELAELDLPEESKAKGGIAEAMKASRRMADMGRLMLVYLGQDFGKKAPVELSEVCRYALSLLTISLPKMVHLRTELPDRGPIINADAVQIQQILTNLVANAAEAMADREGEIVVSIGVIPGVDIGPSRFHPPEWAPKEERYACLSVSDTGIGMDQESLDKAFDPFFSTKFTGRGLGLAVVLGVLKTHEGAVAVESSPGRGSVFRVFLPISVEEAPVRLKAEPATAAHPKERGLVLLVEDEPQLRKLAEILLKRLGYEVITAADGVEALEVFRAHQDRVQCVLCDLTMPRMDGWETLAALRAVRPDLPVILASGYDEASVMRGHHSERPQAFLPKPYQTENLEAALNRALKA